MYKDFWLRKMDKVYIFTNLNDHFIFMKLKLLIIILFYLFFDRIIKKKNIVST